MNKHGFKILAAAGAALALAGCLSGTDQESETRRERELRLQFIAQTSNAALAAAEIPVNPGGAATPGIDVEAIRALGCPKLADLVEDMQNNQGTAEKPLPESALEFLSCFGISGSGTLDDVDVMFDKFKQPEELLDCICGGNALSRLVGGRIELFKAEASRAADVFDASQSRPADTYDGSDSKPATVYGD